MSRLRAMSRLDELITNLDDTARELQVPPAIFRLVGEISRAARELANVTVVQPSAEPLTVQKTAGPLRHMMVLSYSGQCHLCDDGLIVELNEDGLRRPRICSCVQSSISVGS